MDQSTKNLKNICYIAILNHQDEPVYTKNFDKNTDSFEFDLIAFSALDHFETINLKTDTSGGQLGCNIINDDLFYIYGFYYGTR